MINLVEICTNILLFIYEKQMAIVPHLRKSLAFTEIKTKKKTAELTTVRMACPT